MSTKANAFLGTGWSFPPRFNRSTAQVEMVSDRVDIEESLRILFSTTPGERLFHPNFGCDLKKFMFGEINDGLFMEMRNIIYQSILYFEPRISIDKADDIKIVKSTSNIGVVIISLDYKIRVTNSRFNFVYPFFLEEAIAMPEEG